MIEKTIAVIDTRHRNPMPVIPSSLEAPSGHLVDSLGRPLRDLRISVTDRCNFRCIYCMPKKVFHNDYEYLPHHALLSFEEIMHIATLFVAHGVQKIRLTGGEPLLRKNIEKLITMLGMLKTPDGQALDLALTTNGSLLAQKAQALKDAGLNRITVSLDALDDAIFKRMNDVDFQTAEVLHAIDVAHRVGFESIKINMVVKAGMNDSEIMPMARHFRNSPFILRFIEYMDVGTSNGWAMNEVIPSAEIVRRIDAELPLMQIASNYIGETAQRWRYRDGSGEIGVISSVTQSFCSDCTRARLSTEGQLYTCLFATSGYDLRTLLRGDHGDEKIAAAIASVWRTRTDRYSELRTTHTEKLQKTKIEMSYIGG